MENIRNRVEIRLVTNEKDARKLTSKPNYQGRTIFCENLVAFHMKKTKLVFNKPVVTDTILSCDCVIYVIARNFKTSLSFL